MLLTVLDTFEQYLFGSACSWQNSDGLLLDCWQLQQTSRGEILFNTSCSSPDYGRTPERQKPPLTAWCLTTFGTPVPASCVPCLWPTRKLTFCSSPMSVIHSVMRRPLFAASSTLLTTSTAAAAVPAYGAGTHASGWSTERQKATELQPQRAGQVQNVLEGVAR